MKIKIFADGANIEDMKKAYDLKLVDGFTTNPSLMKKSGVKDYKNFARNVVKQIPDMSVSFEVFSDDLETMEKEALVLKEFGKNVFVKIPIQNSKGESTILLIKKLSELGVNINVTAIYTPEQVKSVVDNVDAKSKTYVSVFAGRIGDASMDPVPIVKEAEKLCHSKENIYLLWASTREVYNIIQAEQLGCDIITVPNNILEKHNSPEKTLNELSLDTVKGFIKDINDLGYSIL
ncbi:transaldolase [Helcococcus ovis]|uniref:transaldolase n=1 Tax=Helcococcus ovis TaxID=72026 RepID=UPI0038B9582D